MDYMKKLTTQEFIAKSVEVHGTKYDYSATQYAGAGAKVTITCPEHGAFEQRACNHLLGRGCNQCSVDRNQQAYRLSQEAFVERARAVHGDRYEYPGKYIRMTAKVTIACREHGAFDQQAGNHLSGSGCPSCFRRDTRYTPEEFYAACVVVHNNEYSYEGFTGVDRKFTVICPRHGAFEQRAGLHLEGDRCPRCVVKVSRAEHRIAAFLREWGVVVEQQAKVGGVSVDLWLPEHRIAIEHNGEPFHADVDPHGKRMPRDRHAKKQAAVEAAGARLIQVWGTEWLTRQDQVKALLLTAVGVCRKRIGARKCQVAAVHHADAARFYDDHHIQGAPAPGVNVGLLHDGVLVACMTFSETADRRGAAAAGGADEIRLVRFASAVCVPGGASRLLAAGRALFPGKRVISFSDPRLFTGNMYAALGFKVEARLPPDYHVWVPNHPKLYHKSAFQRSRLESWRQRLGRAEVAPFVDGDPRTEHEMEDLLGVRRIYGVGLVRWVLD